MTRINTNEDNEIVGLCPGADRYSEGLTIVLFCLQAFV